MDDDMLLLVCRQCGTPVAPGDPQQLVTVRRSDDEGGRAAGIIHQDCAEAWFKIHPTQPEPVSERKPPAA
jgi:hypothetical protein